jgi:hypothetical protein
VQGINIEGFLRCARAPPPSRQARARDARALSLVASRARPAA